MGKLIFTPDTAKAGQAVVLKGTHFPPNVSGRLYKEGEIPMDFLVDEFGEFDFTFLAPNETTEYSTLIEDEPVTNGVLTIEGN